ncbi:cytochrome P450 6B7-like [Leptidea sinapis]|uniref:cytochrome P450 6B7-like n=1 Tax=Leptidea sinapis TaxID=189913 RepID=UPI0021228611|nr:cytochrome P450 6B7-like [Leptidea sinapis]XP_050678648.1 cytochrome P450 6B7-like [Leptidea sinapis]
MLNMFVTLVTFIILIIVSIIRLFHQTKYDYWSKRNVKHDIPLPFFGNHFATMSFLKTETETYQDLYNRYYTEKLVGYYKGNKPILIVRDPDLIQNVLMTDFTSFYARGEENPHKEPMMLNLFSVNGDYWRLLRYKLSAAFSKRKVRNSFPLILDSNEKFKKLLQDISLEAGQVSALDIIKRYTIHVICRCGFGVDTDALTDKNSRFLEFGETVLSRPLSYIFRTHLADVFPSLKRFFGKPYLVPKLVKKIIAEITETVRKQRNYKPNGCSDYMDVLLEIENSGKLEGESYEKKNEDGSPAKTILHVDFKCIAAQVYVFFAGGFDTTTIAGAVTLYHLAQHQDVQDQIRKEIDSAFLMTENNLCYDQIKGMQHLERAIKESLRLFSPSGILVRRSVKEYTFPGTDVTIDPDVMIIIPAQAIHLDETYYEKSNEFKPERFSLEAIESRHKCSYLAFGEGPRRCIGERQGMIHLMTGLVTIIRNFHIEPVLLPKTLRAKRVEFMGQRLGSDLFIKIIPRNIANTHP